jgi:hypothetical protein
MLATPKLKPQNNPHNTPDDKLKTDVDVPVRRKQPMIATPTVLTSRQLNLRLWSSTDNIRTNSGAVYSSVIAAATLILLIAR